MTGDRADQKDSGQHKNKQVSDSIWKEMEAARRTTGGRGVKEIELGAGHRCRIQGNNVGGSDERYFGPRAEDRFLIRRSADGYLQAAEEYGGKKLPLLSDKEIAAQRRELKTLLKDYGVTRQEMAKFLADMARLESRQPQLQEVYEHLGANPADAKKQANAEISKTYTHIARMLTEPSTPDHELNKNQRKMLAKQILSQAATPTSIDQGYHNSCAAATIEVRTYVRQPATAAKLVVDVALRGYYESLSGIKTKVSSGSLVPRDEAIFDPPVDGLRSLASQIFQVTAFNLKEALVNSGRRFDQVQPQTKDDCGERIVDTRTRPLQVVASKNFGMMPESLEAVGNEISGRQEHGWLITYVSPERDKGTPGIVSSLSQLDQALTSAKADGKMPVVVDVFTANHPFAYDGGQGGKHAVSVMDILPGNRLKALVDNQWGSIADHLRGNAIPTDSLYLSMRPANSNWYVRELEDIVQANRKKGITDNIQELSLLQLQHQFDNTSWAQYEKAMSDRIVKIGSGWRQLPNHNEDEKSRVRAELDFMVRAMPLNSQFRLNLLSGRIGVLEPKRFDGWLKQEGSRLMRQQRTFADSGQATQEHQLKLQQSIQVYRQTVNQLPEDRRTQLPQI